jgi:integrase
VPITDATPLPSALEDGRLDELAARYGVTIAYLDRVCQSANLGHWHPHELRHSAASLLAAQGVPLKDVSELLGHSSVRITADVYQHLFEPARREVADKMADALWG